MAKNVIQVSLVVIMAISVLITICVKLQPFARHHGHMATSTSTTSTLIQKHATDCVTVGTSLMREFTEKAPVIAAALFMTVTVCLLITVIVLLAQRVSTYEPEPLPKHPQRDLERQVDDNVGYLWLTPHILFLFYLTASVVYLFATEEERVAVAVSYLLIVLVYGLSLYQCVTAGDAVRLLPIIVGNCKWLGLVMAAYMLNRLLRGSLREYGEELKMVFCFGESVGKLLFPFLPKLWASGKLICANIDTDSLFKPACYELDVDQPLVAVVSAAPVDLESVMVDPLPVDILPVDPIPVEPVPGEPVPLSVSVDR